MIQEVMFTTKEFDLLTHLAMNPNRVYSKEQLFDLLWGMDAYGGDRHRYGAYP